MILEALAHQYQRLIERDEPGLSPYGYSPEKISYAIVLSADGEPVDVQSLLDTSGKKPVPQSMSVPQPEKRTSGIKSNFLWDKTSYVLGVSASSKRTAEEHEAFKAFHAQALTGTTDPGLMALLKFLSKWTPERFASAPFTADMLDTNVIFKLDGERQYLHQRPAAQTVRARLLAPAAGAGALTSPTQRCLISGELADVARLHPVIKGVNGAQSSGASIVSFNLKSTESYGKEQGENAPVSEQAAFAYTTVLNHLLRRDPHNRQRLSVGDASVVFWAEAQDADQAQSNEDLLAMLLNPDSKSDEGQEAEKIRHAMEVVAKGRPLAELDPKLDEGTRMFVLGLAPNASRLSIRYWLCDTLGDLVQRLRQHAQDLNLGPSPWKTAPSVWRLALATAPSRGDPPKAKADDVSPLLAGELMRAILTGGRYPQSLLTNVVMRMRSDGDISGVRAALCKAVLNRDLRLSHSNVPDKEVPVSLDVHSTNSGYLLGRLFAVLEGAQRLALGSQVNATIRDRYYGSASATPALVFPFLLRNTQNHMSRIRKDKPGAAINIERDIQEVIDKLPGEFPKHLGMQDQGRFAIGYYHQAQARFQKAEKVDAASNGSNDATDTNKQGGAQ
jgi:CRISPR-associated protein Csd1